MKKVRLWDLDKDKKYIVQLSVHTPEYIEYNKASGGWAPSRLVEDGNNTGAKLYLIMVDLYPEEDYPEYYL